MIRTNTTTNKNRKKSLPKSSYGGGGGQKTKTTAPPTTLADATKKLPSKSGGHSTRTAPTKISTVATTPKLCDSTDLDPLLESKKLKRSNSFILTRKLSKIYHTLTGSKDNLNKIPENDDQHAQKCDSLPNPFKFTRSASLATIPLRRSYRNSNIRESKLEQLREECGHGHTIAASATSPSDTDGNELKHPSQEVGPNANRVSDNERNMSQSDRKNSFSLMSSLRRTFSVTPAKRKSYNSKWSASLMNLQQIDVMVSYENLSFINYDKFNTYEANLIRHMSQTDVNAKLSNRNSVPDERTIFNCRARRTAAQETSLSNDKTDAQTEQYFANYPDVRRRQKQNRVNVNTVPDRTSDVRRSCFEYGEPRPLNRSTYRWSTPCDSPNAQQFIKSNVSVRIEDANGRICDASDVPTTKPTSPGTAPKKCPLKRCISSNSLRRTQSMNDISDGHSDDTTSDPKRTRSFVSTFFLSSVYSIIHRHQSFE